MDRAKTVRQRCAFHTTSYDLLLIRVEQSLGEPLMMLPTDMALIHDPAFQPWVHRYADDKDLFFRDFAAVFAKLIELGVERGENSPYDSAPK